MCEGKGRPGGVGDRTCGEDPSDQRVRSTGDGEKFLGEVGLEEVLPKGVTRGKKVFESKTVIGGR